MPTGASLFVWLPDRRAKWLGHSSYVLTLTTYADYIAEQETENPLHEPVAPASVDTGNVVNLHRSTAG
jgi:integrase